MDTGGPSTASSTLPNDNRAKQQEIALRVSITLSNFFYSIKGGLMHLCDVLSQVYHYIMI